MSEIRHPTDRPPDKPDPPPADVPAADPLAWFDRLVAAKQAWEEVPEGSDTPRADALRGRRPDQFPAKAWDRMCDGVAFDERQQRVYLDRGGANEVTLDNRKRLDSYIPNEEIVSRKYTQLAEVQLDTAIGYLREIDSKYNPRQTVADTPGNRAQLPDQVGRKLRGSLFLEVPPQEGDVPAAVLEEAVRLDIRIRDSDGRDHRLP